MMLFFFASVALALTPGPDNIFVLTQSALFGRKAGLLVTLGLCTGLLVHTAAVALGVAAIFQTSLLAFTVLKVVGAIYLLYLAWQALRAGAASVESRSETTLSAQGLYYRGIVMNVTNPKVAIFFLAFLPQFIDTSAGHVTLQMMTLGGIFMLATLLVFGAIACSAGVLGEWLHRSDKAQQIMHRMAGIVFIGLACRLFLAEQSYE